MAVKPNCAYIIPPNRDMALVNGALQLLESTLARGIRLPIDFFFRSLAQDHRERAICIVLSGSGSDGALGVRAVKGEGGMVMAQTPQSTEYDGMPRSAIATGMVDFVLPPNEMPAQLPAYVAHAFGDSLLPVSSQAPQPAEWRNFTNSSFSALCSILALMGSSRSGRPLRSIVSSGRASLSAIHSVPKMFRSFAALNRTTRSAKWCVQTPPCSVTPVRLSIRTMSARSGGPVGSATRSTLFRKNSR
jgi:hypothetical protein